MKFKHLITLGIILSSFSISNSYALNETTGMTKNSTVKTFGGADNDYFKSVTKTKNEETIVVGNSNSTNAGFVNRGGYDAIIVKYDKNDNQEWIKSFGGSGDDIFNSVITSSDGGIITVGSSYSTDAGFTNKGYRDAVIAKYDTNGNQQWIKTFSGSGDDIFNSVTEISDGGFIAVGSTGSMDVGITHRGNDDAIVVKYDKDGNQQWVKSFGGASFEYLLSVTATSDKGFIVAGYSDSTDAGFSNKGSHDGIMIKYDESGNQQWLKNFGGSSTDVFKSVTETSDGFIAVGYTQSTDAGFIHNGFTDGLIVKCDKNGNQQWIKNFAGSKYEYLDSVVKYSDGSFIIVGYSNSTDAGFISNGPTDAFIVKYDKDGNQLWVKNFGGIGNDYFRSAIAIHDRGILLVGETSSDNEFIKNNGAVDAVLVKYFDGLEPKTATSNTDIYIKMANNISLSIDVNFISFEDFNITEDMEKQNAINLSVTSTLPYELCAYLASEIQNSDKTETIDKSILNIKESSETDYKNFVGINQKLVLKDNQVAGKSTNHSIDLKLKGGIACKEDVYKTVIKFEVNQK